MGDLWPRYPDDVQGGDEPTHSPTKNQNSLLAAERGTQKTRRLETDADNNLYVSVAAGTITATIGEVEIKNDAGSPIPISGTVSITEPVSVDDNGGSLTVDGTVAATQSETWSTIPDRPSQKTGRVYKTAQITAVTASTTLYTVTVGKVLYVTSIILSGFNESTTVAGILNLRDGVTTKIPISIPTAGVGAVASSVSINVMTVTFAEPLQFATNFNAEENAGTLTFSVAFIGYEE